MTAIVYIWKNSPNDTGHASLQIDNEYVSFWPKGAAKAKTDIKFGEMHEAVYPKSYRADCRLERKEADKIININGLDEQKMIEFWLRFKKQSSKYNMLKSNCSTVVASLLESGSGVAPNHSPNIRINEYANNAYMRWFLKLRFMGNYINMWTPNDVMIYALQIKSHKPK